MMQPPYQSMHPMQMSYPMAYNTMPAYMPREHTLYIGDLEESITHEIIYSYLMQFGIISHLKIMYDAQTNRSRGFAFVTYSNQQDGTIFFSNFKLKEPN